MCLSISITFRMRNPPNTFQHPSSRDLKIISLADSSLGRMACALGHLRLGRTLQILPFLVKICWTESCCKWYRLKKWFCKILVCGKKWWLGKRQRSVTFTFSDWKSGPVVLMKYGFNMLMTHLLAWWFMETSGVFKKSQKWTFWLWSGWVLIRYVFNMLMTCLFDGQKH